MHYELLWFSKYLDGRRTNSLFGGSNVSTQEPFRGAERLELTLSRLAFYGVAVWAVLLLVFTKPSIPERIELFTGQEGSSYHDLGLQYAEKLRDSGLEVDVVVTDGPFDNMIQIRGRSDAVALAPSVLDWKKEFGDEDSSLTALGSVAFEPLWVFHRSSLPISRLSDLVGHSVFTEGKGTVSQRVAEILIEKSGLTDEIELQSFGKEKAARQFIESLTTGNADVVFITGHPKSSRLKTLLHAEGLQFLSFDRAEAYAAQIPGITALRVPQGMFDLAHNVPEKDSMLLSKMTCLIADENLHPSVVAMLLVASEEVQLAEMTFPDAAQFPNRENLSLPIHPAARRYFQQGEVGLSKYLPHKLTRFINHLGFFVLPLLTVVFLLIKAVPACLKFWSNLRLKRLFRQLESIEKRHAAGEASKNLLESLDQISQATASMYIPISMSQDYVDFRQFVHDMRERIEAKPGSTSNPN